MLQIELEDDDFPTRIIINGKDTNFRFQSEEELIEFGELFSELFNVYIRIPGKEEMKFEGKLGYFDYSKKVITFDYYTTCVFDDEIDTEYNIIINDKIMYLSRYAEWWPDDMKDIFFIICNETLQTNNTNFIVQYREHENRDFVVFKKYQ